MDGFYSKGQAANILGVSVRQIQLYCQAGQLRRIFEGVKVFIPVEDVDKLYHDRRSHLPVQHADISDLASRLKRAEETIEVLKLGLGLGAERRERTAAEILISHGAVMQDLAQTAWTPKRMSEVADDLSTFRETDVHLLKKLKGVTALTPYFDLVRRMVRHIEGHAALGEKGMDTLHARLIRARDRVLGMLNASMAVRTDIPVKDAVRMHDLLKIEPGYVDSFVAQYISGVLSH